MGAKVIVGLGNPGKEYEDTRHNVGYILLDWLAESLDIKFTKERKLKSEIALADLEDVKLLLVKPLEYMNNSGKTLSKVCRFFKIPSSDVAAVFDEINLPIGTTKLTVGGSDGGHNGVTDILQHFGRDFLRYRVGIGGKAHPEMDLTHHVLGKFDKDEKQALTSKKSQYIHELMLLVRKSTPEAMQIINQRNNASNEQKIDE